MAKRIQDTVTYRTLAEVGLTGREKFKDAAIDAMLLDTGIPLKNPAVGHEEFRGLPLVSLAAKTLTRQGQEVPFNDPYAIAARAMTSSDFTNIAADVANVHMVTGFKKSYETWPKWVGIEELPDFRVNKLSQFEAADLVQIEGEAGEFAYEKLTDHGESSQLLTFGRVYALSKMAIVNNEKGVLSLIPQRIGEAASRKVGDLTYAVLTSNSAMADGNSLFDDTNHGNHIDSGGAPSTAQLGAMVARMKKQVHLGSTTPAGIPPRFFVGPVTIETATENLFQTLQDDSSGNGLIRVYDPRLDSNSEAAYYLAAEKGRAINAYFLDGVAKPVLKVQESWASDGLEFKIRLDCVVGPVDWRGLVKNDGA